MRGVVNPGSFDLIILYDLVLFTDNQWLYMIKYYLMTLPPNKRGALLSLFSQRPKGPATNIALCSWLADKVPELRSPVLQLPNSWESDIDSA
jgi:hypothetical protein